MNLLLGESNELRNRLLHVRWHSVKRHFDVSAPLKRQDDVSDALTVGLSTSETAVLRIITDDRGISIDAIAKQVGVSKSTVDRSIRSLKAKGLLSRVGSTKRPQWVIAASAQVTDGPE